MGRFLIFEYFKFSNHERNQEILHCVKKNIESKLFDKIIILSEKHECKVKNDTIITGKRLTFKDTFEYANKHFSEGDTVFIANSDIYFDETINLLNLDDKTCVALTRYNVQKDGTSTFEPAGLTSQDVWGFRVPIKIPPKSDFFFGILGCDNYIVTLLKEEGYNVINPSKTIRTHHMHLSNIRVYDQNYVTTQRNLTYLDPCYLDEETPDSFCTISTETCLHELSALLLSIRKYHKTQPIYVMVDTPTYNHVKNELYFIDNVHLYIELDKYNGKNREQMEREGIVTEFWMYKNRAMDKALEYNKDVMFLDGDIIVTDELKVHKKFDLGVSPHYIKKSDTDKYGYYNGGLVWTKHKDLGKDWRTFAKTSRFVDQACIEDLAKKYSHFEFDMSYNISWWRLSQSDKSPNEIARCFQIGPSYNRKSLKCIHTHFDQERYNYFNKFIMKVLKSNGKWFELMLIEYIINKSWTILIPKQPLPGKYHHVDDSFRELAPITKGVKTLFVPNISLPRLGSAVCLYDRDQDHWFTNEVEDSSKVLVGNMDVSKYDRKFGPWIYWPRHPKLYESFLKQPEKERTVNTIFIGNIENEVQAQNRGTHWSDVIEVFHLANSHKHKFTQFQYLQEMSKAKYGLCLKGTGIKCHREVECMGLGIVPLITDGIHMHSYMVPPEEGVHYLRVSKPEDVPTVIDENKYRWNEMSKACKEWYMENIHSSKWFHITLKNLVYN